MTQSDTSTDPRDSMPLSVPKDARGPLDALKPGARATHLQRELVKVVMDRHELLSDHPLNMGGEDEGPSPVKLVMGALASCTAVQVGRYAIRKEYPLESVEVTTEFSMGFERVDGPTHARTYVSNVVSTVDIKGRDLTEEMFAELRFVAENCPVGNTLRREVQVEEKILFNDEQVPAHSTS